MLPACPLPVRALPAVSVALRRGDGDVLDAGVAGVPRAACRRRDAGALDVVNDAMA